MTFRALLGAVGVAHDNAGFAATTQSLIAQTDTRWQWTVVVAGGRALLTELSDFAAFEPRITVLDGSGVDPAEYLPLAVRSTRADHLCQLQPGDGLDPGAVAAFRAALAVRPWLYTDEAWPFADGNGQREWRKGGYGPEMLRSQPYAVRSAVLPAAMVAQLDWPDPAAGSAQWYDLVLRVAERCGDPVHLAGPYYLRSPVPEPPPAPWIDGDPGDRCAVVADHCRRTGIPITEVRPIDTRGRPMGQRVVRRRADEPSVSIVIPTRGVASLVYGMPRRHVVALVDQLQASRRYPDLEIVVVYDADTPPDVVQARSRPGAHPVRLVRYSGEFNFSRKCNIGGLAASGEYLCFLNDDIEIDTADWLSEMVALAREPGVGAVGAKLLFADGTLQHAGHRMASGRPGHALFRCAADSIELGGLAQVCGERVGVTAACMVLSARIFSEVGGFWEDLPASYNDVDLCLKIRATGRRIVYTPHAVLHHFESQSRIPVVTIEETEAIQRRWAFDMLHDPYVNPLSVADLDPATH
jgi:GT2 family glycosyltransferase